MFNLKRHRFLIARRSVQLLILFCFMSGPWLGYAIAHGTLSSSNWLGKIWLTDPFTLLQSLATGHVVAATALWGVIPILAFYMLLGGRVFCGWVCPVNMVSDAAQGLRRLLGLSKASLLRLDKRLRYVLLGAVLIGSAISGALVWEFVNPISLSMRALVFSLWIGGLTAISAVFLFDFLVQSNGWCGHICPVGALYGLLGKTSVLTVSAVRRSQCTSCGECFAVCPEPQVISPALRGIKQHGIQIDDVDCLRCGRCLDVCEDQVFAFTAQKPVFLLKNDNNKSQSESERATSG